MPQNLARDEDNARRKNRLKDIKRGPGVFVYDGSWCDTEWIPTYLRTGKEVAALGHDGAPLIDAQGRQVFKNAGEVVRDGKGNPMYGGVPVQKKIPMDTVRFRGVELPKGVPVRVEDPTIALSLRCKDGFAELSGAALEEFEAAEHERTDDVKENVEISKLSKKQLIDLAANEGIEVPAGASKSEIVELVAARSA